jgi:hypothetical protein
MDALCAFTPWLVTGAVRYRFITVALGLLFFAASLAGASLLPSGFLPVTDTARSMLGIELPPGSQLSDTEAVTDIIVNRMRKRPEVASVFVDGGRIPNGAVDVGRAGLTINYVPKSKRSLSQQQLEQAIGRDLADIPDIRYWFVDDNGQRNVKFIVTGQDNATVANVASELAAQMRGSRSWRMSCPAQRSIARSCEFTHAATWRCASVYRPRVCRKRSGWRPSAMSARRLQNSMPAIGPSRSASCSRKTRAPTGKFSNRYASRLNAEAACRSSPSPT